jgi:putative endonuclease
MRAVKSVNRKATAAPKRLAAEARGRHAEWLAALVLLTKFYRLLGRRVKTPLGELDLVALSPSGILCFVEVKARIVEGAAAEAVSLRQRDRIVRASALYLGARPGLRHRGVRFDAILVMPRRWPRHLKDAWRPDIR